MKIDKELSGASTTLSQTFINIRVPMIKKEIDVYAFVSV